MSAIFGICYFDGRSAQREDIEALSLAMRDRAPEEAMVWCEGPAVFGCRMLRTTPESLDEELPFHDIESNSVLVADARIDNRSELMSQLDIQDKGISDSQLILASYKKWGDECATKLIGDFVFVVWNSLQHKLVCFRDRVGGRGLAYVKTANYFAFATDSEALLQLPEVSPIFCESYLAAILVPEYPIEPVDSTWFENVKVLRPGGKVDVTRNGSIQAHIYWQFEPDDSEYDCSENYFIEQFNQLFSEAVNSRLRCVTSPAVMLSGGMDSASLAGMLIRNFRKGSDARLDTYSTISDFPDDCVESEAIFSVTGADCFNPHYMKVPSFTGMGGVEELKKLFIDQAHPVDSDILLPAMMVRQAARDGHNVMLYGLGGDLTMWSISRHIGPLLREGRLVSAYSEAKLARSMHPDFVGMSWPRILAMNFYYAFAPDALKNLRSRGIKPRYFETLAAPLNRDFAQRVGMVQRVAEDLNSTSSMSDVEKHVPQLQQLASGLMGYGRIGSRVGMEMRDPWSDLRIANFFLNLPQRYKVKNGRRKHIPRMAFMQELDQFVLDRYTREHLGFHFHERVVLETKDTVDGVISSDLDLIAPYVNIDRVQNAYQAHLAGDRDATRYVFELMNIILWIKRFRG